MRKRRAFKIEEKEEIKKIPRREKCNSAEIPLSKYCKYNKKYVPPFSIIHPTEDIKSSLSLKEYELIKNVENIYKSWGYRQSLKGDIHSNYENKMHEDTTIYPFTSITDPLFRSLQQNTVFKSDLTGKYRTYDVGDKDSISYQNLSNLLQLWLLENENWKYICELAKIDLDENDDGNSWIFGALVTSAKIIIHYANREYSLGNEETKHFRNCILNGSNLENLEDLENEEEEENED